MHGTCRSGSAPSSAPRPFRAGLPALIAAALLAALGCNRCGGGAAPPDAGQDAAHPGSPTQTQAHTPRGFIPATDLRSAVILIYPEWRGTMVTGGRALLTRTVTWKGDASLAEALTPLLEKRAFKEIASRDGRVTAKRDPFRFEAQPSGDSVTLHLWLPLDNDQVNRIIHSPSAIGTEAMAAMMPSPEAASAPRESFTLELEYIASRPRRATFLVRQLVEGLMAARWTPTAPLEGWEPEPEDGGIGEIPSPLQVTLTEAHTGASLEIRRNERNISLRYDQPLGKAP